MFTFFTTNEANAALPDVIKKYEYALAKNTEIKKMHDNINDSEKLSFWEGKLTALRWVRGRE